MNILITNDDGYKAKGIRVLAEIMRQFGSVTVIAPKKHQSGMSMAVSLGLKQIAYRDMGNIDGADWSYLDATPASCVKFGLNVRFPDKFPDVVVSGINHGSNASSASCYSGTLGAVQEAALNGIPGIGVSLNSMNPDADFSSVQKFFPAIFDKIMGNLPERKGIYYNVNFPKLAPENIKGLRVGCQGKGRWIREFQEWDPSAYSHLGITPEMLDQTSVANPEDGEKLYMMVGDYLDDPQNSTLADHHLMQDGYVSIVAHNIDTTDYDELQRITSKKIDMDFQK